jgi:membrane dipeptidase
MIVEVNDLVSQWGISSNSAKIHQEAYVWDNTLPWSKEEKPEIRDKHLSRMKEAGHDVLSLTLGGDRTSLSEAIHKIARERDYFRSNGEKFVLVESVADIKRSKQENKLAIVFHFQGTNPIESNVQMVEVYYRLGIRHMLMAYNLRNPIGDGCKERMDSGLSHLGVSLVQEMNRVGMVVDCSHTGYNTTMDVMDVSTAPVVFSHSNPKALNDHPRNILDDQIKKCAGTGGVVGVNGVGLFLGNNDNSTENQIRHVDYLVQMIGADHVGFGNDHLYAPEESSPSVWNPPAPGDVPWSEIRYTQPEQMPKFTEGLLKKGYSESDVSNILGGNWLRIAEQVWK